MAQFVQRSSKLSPDEAALLEEGFPDIVAAHRELVASLLRKHGVLKSRLLAAKRVFFALAEALLPPSQRAPVSDINAWLYFDGADTWRAFFTRPS